VNATAVKLLRLTGPIALSEVLWGMSTFIYAVVFTRLGTMTLAASQIVVSLESIFIVASHFDLRKNGIWSVPPSPTLEKRSSGTATGAPVFSVYCASKASIRNFVRSCIVELKEQRIHINVISPGPPSPPRPQPICISRRPKRGLCIITVRGLTRLAGFRAGRSDPVQGISSIAVPKSLRKAEPTGFYLRMLHGIARPRTNLHTSL
jgi:NAD(P)-dependent dehydrogenase (short-subunit alcohol dehydrogenase family)